MVLKGSKDLSDSVVGAVESCLKDLGEPIDTQQVSAMMKRLAQPSVNETPGGLLLKTNDGKTVEKVMGGQDVAQQMRTLFKRLR